MDHAFRLTCGNDLRKSIEDYCRASGIKAGAVVTAVGCLYRAVVRLADGSTRKQFDGHYEIVSLVGTIAENGCHLHISFSDENGQTYGGHLCYGCLVNTTAEVVVRSLDHRYRFHREFDESTGYDELVVTVKEEQK